MENLEIKEQDKLREDIIAMQKKNKIRRGVIWGICLFTIVVVSLAISFRLYGNSYGMGTLMLFGDARKPGIYKHEEIYTMVQFANLMIMFFVNGIGHIFDWWTERKQNIHFYGITNIILCFTMIIIDSFKYGFEYLFAYPELKEILVPITIFIGSITGINILGYIFMIIRNMKRKKKVKSNFIKLNEDKEYNI